MTGNDRINELSRGDIDRIAGRMRPMLGDVEIVEAEGEVHRVPIVEPMRAREGEDRGEAEEQASRRPGVPRRQRSGGQPVEGGVSHRGQKACVSNRRSMSPCQSPSYSAS